MNKEEYTLLKAENKELIKRIHKLNKELDFYEITEWGMKNYRVLEEFRKIINGGNNKQRYKNINKR